jgi:hypothetical protein
LPVTIASVQFRSSPQKVRLIMADGELVLQREAEINSAGVRRAPFVGPPILTVWLFLSHCNCDEVHAINWFMESPERIRLITKSYCALQGLRMVPLWLFLALRPWSGILPNHRPTYIRDNLSIVTFLFCISWIWLSGRYCRRHYGRVESKPQSGWFWLFGLAFLTGYVLCMFADDKNPPVSFIMLWWASYLLMQALAIGGIPVRRYYYGIAAVCVTGLALVPSTGRVTANQLMSPSHPSGLVFLGLVLTTVSLLDHFQLVRMIEHPSEGANA